MLRYLMLCIVLILCLVSCGGGGGPTAETGSDPSAFEKELGALACPDGVDSGLWEGLKQDLRDAVLTAGEHTASSVPDTEQETVIDLMVTALNDDGSIELDWGYINFGDYNQDKLVNVNDLTPIGIYFGYTTEHPDWLRARFADGNRDGQVGIGDITLLGVNYLQRVEGYQVGYDTTEAAAFVVLDGITEFAASYVDEETFQRRFSYTVAEPVEGAYYMVRPYEGDETGLISNRVLYELNDPDIIVTVPSDMQGGVDAQWVATWSNGSPPYMIIWEFNGGAKDFGMELAPNPCKMTHAMINDSRTEPAEYHYRVTVEDKDGFTGVAEGDYTVGPNPHPVLDVAVPAEMRGGLYAVWQFEWEYGMAPWILECDFQGGASQLHTDTINRQDQAVSLQMVNDDLSVPVTYRYAATVTDAAGYSTTATGEFTIGPCAIPVVEVTVPQNMAGGGDAEWMAEIQGGTGPYTVEWLFNGGAADPAPVAGIESMVVLDVAMINYDMVHSTDYTYAVKVTDSEGLYRYVTGDYTVGPGPNQVPEIVTAAFHCEDQTLDIVVSDLNPDESFTVMVTEPPGFTVDVLSRSIPVEGPFSTHFNWTVDLPVEGKYGFTEISVEDSHGGITSTTVQMVMPEPDILYAVPMRAVVAVDEPVTVLVLTGATSNPFLNACLISIECPDGMSYIYESWNPGGIGAGERDVDGIWSLMDPQPPGFGVQGCTFVEESGGLAWYECNCTPETNGNLLGTAGDLFNLQFAFDTPGVYEIRLIEFSAGVNRTYYEDWDEYSYPWGDCSNVHTGLVTTITVE